jgi:hypothetical protein
MAWRPFKGSGKGEHERGLAPSLFFAVFHALPTTGSGASSLPLIDGIETVLAHGLILQTVLHQEGRQS